MLLYPCGLAYTETLERARLPAFFSFKPQGVSDLFFTVPSLKGGSVVLLQWQPWARCGMWFLSPAQGLSASIRVLCLALPSCPCFPPKKEGENAAPVINLYPFRTTGASALVSRRSGSSPYCWSACHPAGVPLLSLKCKSPVVLLTTLLIGLEK